MASFHTSICHFILPSLNYLCILFPFYKCVVTQCFSQSSLKKKKKNNRTVITDTLILNLCSGSKLSNIKSEMGIYRKSA